MIRFTTEAAEGEGVEPSRLIARPASNRLPSPIGLSFRSSIGAAGTRTRISALPRRRPPVGRRSLRSVVLPDRRECACCNRRPQNWTCRGIEPRSPGCEPSVFPLDQQPFATQLRVRGGHSGRAGNRRSARELNPVFRLTMAACRPKHLQTNCQALASASSRIEALAVGIEPT